MGNNTKNIIEINGKRYDAVTGSHLGASPVSVASSRGKSVDGFTRMTKVTPHGPLKPMPAIKRPAPHYVAGPKNSTPKTNTTTVVRKQHQPGITVAPHSPQRATTLMRSAVKKPLIKSPDHIKAQQRTDILAKVPTQTVAPKISYNSINKDRHLHAERMIKSPSVSRYGTPTRINPVRPVAIPSPSVTRAVAPVTAVKPPVQPTIKPATKPDADDDIDIFEQALADAQSHEERYTQPKYKMHKKRSKLFGIFGTGLVLLLLIGFIGYKNTPTLSVKLASYRAGLHATLPSEQPSGYTFGYLNYQPGLVKVNYESTADSRQFNISQKASSWDSQALLSNFVASASSAYKTYQRAGRTVYLLGNNTATWVDSGIWYTVDGNDSLSSGQLLDVATSM